MKEKDKTPGTPAAGTAAQKPEVQKALEKAREQRQSAKKKARGLKRRRFLRRVLYAAVSVVVLAGVAFAGVTDIYNALNSMISGEETESGVLDDNHKSNEEYQLKGIYNFLVCGIDYSNGDDETDDDPNSYGEEGDKIGNTDLILYVQYDTINHQARILQLPRDIYVGDEVPTGNKFKINNVYRNAEDEDNRMAALVKVLYEQYHLPVDNYFTIDMDVLKEFIDYRGGIEVYVPVDLDDPRHPDSIIYKGWRWFTGEEAEYFLRNRYATAYSGHGDVMRLETQQYFYSAIFRDFKSLSYSDLVLWMRVLMWERLKTDMDSGALITLAANAMAIESEDIVFIRPSMGGLLYNGQAVMTLIPEEFAGLLNEYFRLEGESYSPEELDIPWLEIDPFYGKYEASIRDLSQVQQAEQEGTAALEEEGGQAE